MTNLLAIVSKYPASGNVKTRLGQIIGMEHAANLARAMLLDLIDNHLGQSYDLSLQTNDIENMLASKQFVSNIPVREVSGDFLRGPKSILLDVFTYYLQCYQKVIVICADTPMVGKTLIENAFRDLDFYDIVIGHDLGPGYYLIGMKKLHDLFTSVKEEKDKRRPYYKETMVIIYQLGLQYKLVESRIDVDTVDDLHLVKWSTQEGDWTRTVRLIRELGLWDSSKES